MVDGLRFKGAEKGFHTGVASTVDFGINECSEMSNAYIFSCKDDENYEGGSGHTPCVIIKETGEAVNMATYIAEYRYGKELRNFNL